MNIVEAYTKFNGQNIILISGFSGSGKTKLAKFIADLFKFKLIDQTASYYPLEQFDKPENYVTIKKTIKILDWDDIYKSVDWGRFNRMVKENMKDGVVVIGFGFPTKLLEFKPDFHIHVKINKKTLLANREKYLQEHPETNNQYKIIATNLAKSSEIRSDDLTKSNKTDDLTESTKTDDLTESNETDDLTESTKTDDLTESTKTDDLTESNETDNLTESNETDDLTETNETDDLTEFDETDDLTESNETETDQTGGVTEPENQKNEISFDRMSVERYIIDDVTYPHYIRITEESKIDKYINTNEITEDRVRQEAFSYLINRIGMWIEEYNKNKLKERKPKEQNIEGMGTKKQSVEQSAEHLVDRQSVKRGKLYDFNDEGIDYPDEYREKYGSSSSSSSSSSDEMSDIVTTKKLSKSPDRKKSKKISSSSSTSSESIFLFTSESDD
jgi:adenylate kinase family enzyme